MGEPVKWQIERMTMNSELVYSDATKLAELIRTREVSPVEVVQAHLDRIAAVEPQDQCDRHGCRRCARGREGGGSGGPGGRRARPAARRARSR